MNSIFQRGDESVKFWNSNNYRGLLCTHFTKASNSDLRCFCFCCMAGKLHICVALHWNWAWPGKWNNLFSGYAKVKYVQFLAFYLCIKLFFFHCRNFRCLTIHTFWSIYNFLGSSFLLDHLCCLFWTIRVIYIYNDSLVFALI